MRENRRAGGLTSNQHIGDTKAGTLVGIDRYGNKYFENMEEELPLRTRWIDFKEYEWDPYVPYFPCHSATSSTTTGRATWDRG